MIPADGVQGLSDLERFWLGSLRIEKYDEISLLRQEKKAGVREQMFDWKEHKTANRNAYEHMCTIFP